MFNITIIHDPHNKPKLDGLVIPNAEISWFVFNDESWFKAKDKIDFLIIVYDALTKLPIEMPSYEEMEGRGAILLVCACAEAQDCPRLEGFNKFEPTHLSHGLGELIQRIQSRLGVKCLHGPFTETSIFISYRKNDRSKAESLVAALRNFDYRVTWDQDWGLSSDSSDKEIKEAIDSYINKSVLIILVHTRHTKESTYWVRYEIEKCLSYPKLIYKLSFDEEVCETFKGLIEHCDSLRNASLEQQAMLAIPIIEKHLSSHYLTSSW